MSANTPILNEVINHYYEKLAMHTISKSLVRAIRKNAEVLAEEMMSKYDIQVIMKADMVRPEDDTLAVVCRLKDVFRVRSKENEASKPKTN